MTVKRDTAAAAAAAATAAAVVAVANADTQRALGRIEGVQQQILSELRVQREEFATHQAQDLSGAQVLQKALEKQRSDMVDSFAAQEKSRDEHLGKQDVKLDEIVVARSFERGVGWVILGIVGFLGAAVIALASGWFGK